VNCHECVDLARFYHDTDIAASELCLEILDCKMFPSPHYTLLKTPLELRTFLVSYGEVVFTNLRISLQILLTIAVSIAANGLFLLAN